MHCECCQFIGNKRNSTIFSLSCIIVCSRKPRCDCWSKEIHIFLQFVIFIVCERKDVINARNYEHVGNATEVNVIGAIAVATTCAAIELLCLSLTPSSHNCVSYTQTYKTHKIINNIAAQRCAIISNENEKKWTREKCHCKSHIERVDNRVAAATSSSAKRKHFFILNHGTRWDNWTCFELLSFVFFCSLLLLTLLSIFFYWFSTIYATSVANFNKLLKQFMDFSSSMIRYTRCVRMFLNE